MPETSRTFLPATLAAAAAWQAQLYAGVADMPLSVRLP
jgi:hypothetical protein